MAAPFLKLADDLRGEKAVGFVNGYPNLEQRMMAQSMLAPTLITSDARPPLVIAAFPTDHELDSFLAGPPPEESGPLGVRRRFSPGMALLEHADHTEPVQPANAASPIVEVKKSVDVLWLILSLASPLITGWFVVRMLWPKGGILLVETPTPRWVPGMLRLSCAIGIGAAVVSANYLIWRPFFPAATAAYRMVDCLLIPLAAWFVFRRFGRGDEPSGISQAVPVRWWAWALMATMFVVAIGALLTAAGMAWERKSAIGMPGPRGTPRRDSCFEAWVTIGLVSSRPTTGTRIRIIRCCCRRGWQGFGCTSATRRLPCRP